MINKKDKIKDKWKWTRKLEELRNYIRTNKDICWDINNCDGCFQKGNCGRELKEMIQDIQNY